MYTRFFGLNRLPFEASPDPGFLFDGPVHREAIASIEYAVATRMGFIMLTGEVGLGKTTVIRAFLDRFDRDRLLPIYVFHPLLSFDDLLELLCDELGLTLEAGITSFNRLRSIQRELIRLYDEKRQVILVIDEAQRLPEDTLENLRLLTNLETNDTKLLQIVLVGQPELEEILAQPHLRQLEQRIVLKARLDNLKPDDAVRYLNHRLTLAGADDPDAVISPAAQRAIAELADGVPRRMNILANRTLIDAFGADEKPIGVARVRRIAASNTMDKPKAVQRPVPWAAIAAILIVAIGGLALAVAAHRLPPPFELAWSSTSPNPPPKPAEPKPVESPKPPPQIAQADPVAPPPVAPPAPSSTPALVAAPATVASETPAPSSPPPAVVAPEPAKPAVSTASVIPPQPVPPPAAMPVSPPPALADASTPLTAETLRNGFVVRDTPYVVNHGDTLWKICLDAYGPDVAPSMISKVMSRNKIASDVKLLWGKTIILPASGTS